MQRVFNHWIDVTGWGWQVPAWGRQTLTMGLRRTQLLLFQLWEDGRSFSATEAAESQLPEQRGGAEQCHCSPIHGPVQGQGTDLPVCCELHWGAAASQYCVHSRKQLQFSFLTCYVVWEEKFLLYARGTPA